MIHLIGIKTNEGYLITDNLKNEKYFNSKIGHLLINGEVPVQTYKNYWFKLDSKPIKIEERIPSTHINKRYELKDEFKKAGLSYPLSFLYDEIRNNEDHEFYQISQLYEYKFDVVDESFKEIDFHFEEILEIEVYRTPVSFSYKRAGEYSHRDYGHVTRDNVQYDIISQILMPDILHHEAPCTLSRKETYDIIRAHVRENIDPRVARIYSDYDFCFAVQKVIKVKEYQYQVDLNKGGSRKKPKYQTKTANTRQVEIFRMGHESYQGYPNIEPFTGENLEDLQKNIDSYLSHLMAVINEPLKDCEHCNGVGVVLND